MTLYNESIAGMRIFRGFGEIPQLKYGVATIGSFDGVHSGHMELLRRVNEIAAQHGGESMVVTFEPHPRYVLGSGERLRLLSTLDEKIVLLGRAGIDAVVVVPFTVEFSHTSPREFIERDIVGSGIRSLVVGYNHRFGYNKEGDYNYLEARSVGLDVHMVEQQQIDSSKVSSTIIRQTVAKGMMEKARQLSGHPYLILCDVSADGLVSGVGEHKLLPADGRYDAVVNGKPAEVEISDGVLRICDTGFSGRVEIEL